jgi:hypothetical protein
VEAAIDFADEPLDTLGGAQVRRGLEQARSDLALCAAMPNAAVACAMACTRC